MEERLNPARLDEIEARASTYHRYIPNNVLAVNAEADIRDLVDGVRQLNAELIAERQSVRLAAASRDAALENAADLNADREREARELAPVLADMPEMELEELLGVRAARCIERLTRQRDEARACVDQCPPSRLIGALAECERQTTKADEYYAEAAQVTGQRDAALAECERLTRQGQGLAESNLSLRARLADQQAELRVHADHEGFVLTPKAEAEALHRAFRECFRIWYELRPCHDAECRAGTECNCIVGAMDQALTALHSLLATAASTNSDSTGTDPIETPSNAVPPANEHAAVTAERLRCHGILTQAISVGLEVADRARSEGRHKAAKRSQFGVKALRQAARAIWAGTEPTK